MTAMTHSDPAASNDHAHDDGRLMHELTAVNTMVTRYVVRFLDADAGRTAPISIADEQALADALSGAAVAVRARATRRARDEQP